MPDLSLPRRAGWLVGASLVATLVGVVPAAAPAGAGAPAAGSAVPTGFAANSMTWLSPTVGWILGTAACGTKRCTDVVQTADAGTTWHLAGTVAAPVPQVGNPGTGVTQLRFGTSKVGFAYGPGLYRTTNGGATFASQAIPGAGKQILALAAGPGYAYAVVSPCAWGTGICSTKPLTLWRSALAGSGAWTAVPLALPANDAADVAVHGNTVYVVDAQRNVTGKADKFYASTDGVHFAARPVPCAAFVDVALLQVVATSATGVDLLCDGDPGFGKAVKVVFRSTDTGRTDSSAGSLGRSYGIQAELAASPTGNLAVAAWSIGTFMYVNNTGGTAWSMPIGWSDGGRGWNDLSYVSAGKAWVVYSPVDLFHGLGKVYLTTNAGKTWTLAPL